ncbi:MAG: HD domain-containing protein [Desulfuromonadia bacterium]
MGRTYVADIRERDQITEVFLVKDKTIAMAKNGKPYMNLRLMDRTGEVEGKIWDDVDTLDARFTKDDFVRITAKASTYLGKMQLVISSLTRVDDDQVPLEEFLPRSSRTTEEMTRELASLVNSFANPYLKRLMQLFMADEQFMKGYVTAPAAKGMHHVYLGGLLEHSLSVARLIDLIHPLYPRLDRDLLMTGALLHDAGKVREMAYRRSFDYTDEGKLVGHITIGVEMIGDKIRGIPDFPPQLAILLKHLILSHHGEYEYGSPKRPKTLDAIALNFLDDLDAKMNGVTAHMDRDEPAGSEWTAYHKLYDRYFYRGGGEMDGGAPKPPLSSGGGDQKKGGGGDRDRFANSPFERLQNLELF